METYIYDGSFDGLLCAFAAAIEVGENRCTFNDHRNTPPRLFDDSIKIETESSVAIRLWRRLKNVGGDETTNHLLHVYLSEISGFERDLYQFARFTILSSRSLFGWYGNDSFRRTKSMARKVMREAHRFCGLLRFMELHDGSLYAAYEPDHNITPILSPHFCRRMPNERWLIHDRKRDSAVLWDGKDLLPVEQLPADFPLYITEEECTCQKLWKAFTRAITIPERWNPALQKQFMPKRYWQYLTEKQPQ